MPAGTVNSVPQAFAHPHVQHRDILVRRGAYTGVRSPMRLSGTPGTPGRAPPRLAQDAPDILADLGFTPGESLHLSQLGAVPLP